MGRASGQELKGACVGLLSRSEELLVTSGSRWRARGPSR